MTMNKLPYETLYNEYCVNFLNEKEIAEKYNVTIYSIKKSIKEYYLKRDSHGAHSFKNSLVKNKYHNFIKEKISKEVLYKWYIIEDHPYKEGPRHFNISQWQFDKLCKEYDLKKDRKKSSLKSVKTRETKNGGKEKYKEVTMRKQRNTIKEKYGSLNNFYNQRRNKNKSIWENNHEEILNKIYRAKERNKSFNTSTPEIAFKNYLINKYGENDIVTNYCENRYPFKCDFYIKSKDLFIELNLHWSHGGHPFNPQNPEDIIILKRWEEKAKNSKFYENAIITWTERDVEKQKTAEQNHLNYCTIYSVKDFENEGRFDN